MRIRPSGVLRYIAIALVFFALLRFLPFLIRAAQGLAIGVRAYWWVALPMVVAIWFIVKARRRKERSAVDGARDVTDSIR